MAEPLTIRFATDTTAAQSAIANLAGNVVTNMGKVRESVERTTSAIAMFPTVAKGAGILTAAYIALNLVLNATSKAAEEARKKLEGILKVASGASGAGVGTDFFQRWTDQAKELNLEVDKLSGMLEKAREASTVRVGDKGNSSALQGRLEGYVRGGTITSGQARGVTDAADQEARIRAMLDLIDQLREQGASLAAYDLANTMFGADFEAKLRNGVDMTGKMRTQLDSVSSTRFSPEMIAQAQEIDRQLEAAERTMREGWAPIQQDILQWEMDQLRHYAEMKQIIGDIVAAIGGWYGYIRDIGTAIDKLGNHPFWDKLRQMLPETGPEMEIAPPGGFKPPEPPKPDIAPRNDTSRWKPPPARSSSGDDETSLQRYVDQLEESVKLAWTEADAVGKTNEQRAVAVALVKARAAAERDVEAGQRARAELTEEEIANVTHLAEVEQRAKDTAKGLQDQLDATAEAARFMGQQMTDALADMIIEGRSFDEVMQNVIKSIARAALQSALMGDGPFGGGKSSGGGIFGAIGTALTSMFAAPTGHTGGIVGQDLGDSFRHVPAMMFATAPRLHSGLLPDEFPAILQKGEAVLTRAQQQAIRGNSGPTNVNLKVDVSGARGNQEIMTMVQQGVRAGMEQTIAVTKRNVNSWARENDRRSMG